MKGHKKQRCQRAAVLQIDANTKYVGSVYDKKPSGHGILSTAEWTYEGYFLDGKRHGYGTQSFVCGRLYEGEWRFGHYHGPGTLRLETGSVYSGHFHTGGYHGHGALVGSGESYVGSWNHGTFHGQGTHKTCLGTYEGMFLYNLRHGSGTFIDGSGNCYVGSWKRGVREGYGVYTTSESVYEGSWQRDLESGHGTLKHQTRGTYIGSWKRGKRHRKGKHTWADGSVYEGGWSYGKRTGHGILRNPDGSFYKGFWLKDEYNGSGTLSFSGASCFEGVFCHNLRDGMFVETRADGTVCRGPWVNDLRHGTFKEGDVSVLYVWNASTTFDSAKKALLSVSKLIRSKDYVGARVILEHYPELICWKTFWNVDKRGHLVKLLEADVIIHILQTKAWTIYKSKRYAFLENLVCSAPERALESAAERVPELFDAITKEFTANPWMVRDQSYSAVTRKELLRGIFLGECGRCEPMDPFTRLPLTKQSGKYLSRNKQTAKKLYEKFMKAIDVTPPIRELAKVLDMQDFEQHLKNAREANDRETIRRLMKERNEYIKQTNCY